MALLLGTVGGIASVAVIPYVVAMSEKPLSLIDWRKALPLGFIQGTIINGVVSYVGLRWAGRCGLDAPIFRQCVTKECSSSSTHQDDTDEKNKEDKAVTPCRGRLALRPLLISSAVGVGVGTALVAIDFWIAPRFLSPEAQQVTSQRSILKIPLFARALACLYGGFVEEIQLRLFIMSGSCALISWLGGLVRRFFPKKSPATTGNPTESESTSTNNEEAVVPVQKSNRNNAVHMTASVVSSLLFAVGHLPAAFTIMANHPEIPRTWFIGRVLALNFIAGMPFSVLYSKFSLEYSMIAHFVADLVMHVPIA